MELETLFTDVKWNILKILSKKEMSPLEISNELGTTISNISQQLKLLEMAGLVKKQKVSNRERGKPRSIFSIAKNSAYLILVMDTLAEKKLLPLTEYNKAVLRIWMLEDPTLHYYLEKFFWEIEEHLHDIKAIAVNTGQGDHVLLISENPDKLKQKIGTITIKKSTGESKKIIYSISTEEQAKKKKSSIKDYHIIYDPDKILWGIKKE